jgi:S-adenosylmethionine:tRNA ribosyltransferase-isomerase
VAAVDVPEYDLPESAIAQQPVEPRDSARLLDAISPGGPVAHRTIRDLPGVLQPGDVLVVNSSRVVAARLHLYKLSGGAAEVLLLEPDPHDDQAWIALVRPGRRLAPGALLARQPGAGPELRVEDRLGDGQRRVRFLGDPAATMRECGRLALPPYIHEPLADPERYQTVYADRPGSIAAPTAGLHLTPGVLDECAGRGIEVKTLDLAVGLATFRPVASARAEDHVMHVEHYCVPASTWESCQRGGRVVAVGTTTVRALETAAATGQLQGSSDLFILPGFRFSVVDVLLTNFHLPRSSLLLLLEAFCGVRWRDLYRTALEGGYRFLSFGDAMIVGRQ